MQGLISSQATKNSVRELALRMQRSFYAEWASAKENAVINEHKTEDARSALNNFYILNASSRTEFFVACDEITTCMPSRIL